MKIKFIGTGDIWNKANSACYIIDDKILIDLPNGSMKAMYKQNVNTHKIKHVLITHLHGDHYFDLPFYLLSKRSLPQKDNIYIYVHFFGKRKILKLFMMAFPFSLLDVMRKSKIHFFYRKRFHLLGYDIEKIRVKHGKIQPAYGYILKKDNITVGFTGDTMYCPQIENMAKRCDLLVCDTTYERGDHKHMGLNNLLMLSEKYPMCRFVASHLSKNTQKLLSDNKYHNIMMVKDGQIVNIGSEA